MINEMVRKRIQFWSSSLLFLFLFLFCFRSILVARGYAQTKNFVSVQSIKKHKEHWEVILTYQKIALPNAEISNQYWSSYLRLGYLRQDFIDSTPKVRAVPINLKITYKGQSIFVPHSCYADLADINDISIKSNLHGCIVIVSGGDASLSYDAHIFIKYDHVYKRRVKAGEMEDTYEETNYH